MSFDDLKSDVNTGKRERRGKGRAFLLAWLTGVFYALLFFFLTLERFSPLEGYFLDPAPHIGGILRRVDLLLIGVFIYIFPALALTNSSLYERGGLLIKFVLRLVVLASCGVAFGTMWFFLTIASSF